jgi:hypothetical protein
MCAGVWPLRHGATAHGEETTPEEAKSLQSSAAVMSGSGRTSRGRQRVTFWAACGKKPHLAMQALEAYGGQYNGRGALREPG